MERFVNILIIEKDLNNAAQLESILLGSGNNLIFSSDKSVALSLIEKLNIGIILINIDNPDIDSFELLQDLNNNERAKNSFKIIMTQNYMDGKGLVRGFKEGAVDFILIPFNENIVKAKIEIFKSIYFKNLRINQLLGNIFPETVLADLDTTGKFSPRKVEEGVVLFTDFVSFTSASRDLEPIELLHKLEYYFNRFDEIIDRYELEKIKTMGDAYMILAGVTESNSLPAVRATLTAIEIRNFIVDQNNIAKALGEQGWDIRIGMHSGQLVAGIIGTKKMSFDVWGDTVNIAARAEQNSNINSITITEDIADDIAPYFDITYRGKVEIKNGGEIDLYEVNQLKTEFSLFNEGNYPNRELRLLCDLMPMDFGSLKRFMVNKLKSMLPYELEYHSVNHTLKVERAAIRIATLEGVSEIDMILLRTAILFHDSGFIMQYEDNEDFGIKFAQAELPKFGYSERQIKIVCDIIHATKTGVTPNTLLEMIMCDADHDYLGRADYHTIAKALRRELENFGKVMTDYEWLDFQINYLRDVHKYYTQTEMNIRNKSKWMRIQELEELRSLLNEGDELC
ncbi:MAG: response regulator [Brumimicrobium sp.]|nr:response regulator [Brumimicrobium sp.]